jgi:hypothetical protein
VLGVMVQGAYGHLQHRARGDALPQYLTVPRSLSCEPAGDRGGRELSVGGGLQGPGAQYGMRNEAGGSMFSQSDPDGG